MLIAAIQKALLKSTQHQDLKDVMEYAVLPAGKLFRPKLVEALSHDLGSGLTPQHLHLAAAIELHHAYTLVHDDLPAMDNDPIRRGKPSTHIKFGEWKAILAGDALLISSFEELMHIQHPESIKLHRLFSWCTGAKGLISGQFLDLEADGEFNLSKIIRIHELKTARLIQVSTLGTYLISEQKSANGVMDFFRIGREIGLSFQLLDDLSELTEAEVSEHELKINPFLLSAAVTLKELNLSHQRLTKLMHKHKLTHLEQMLRLYFQDTQKKILTQFQNVEKNIAEDKAVSEIKNWLTSYV